MIDPITISIFALAASVATIVSNYGTSIKLFAEWRGHRREKKEAKKLKAAKEAEEAELEKELKESEQVIARLYKDGDRVFPNHFAKGDCESKVHPVRR